MSKSDSEAELVKGTNATSSDMLLLVETLTGKNKALEAELQQVIEINKELSDELGDMIEKYKDIAITINNIKQVFSNL